MLMQRKAIIIQDLILISVYNNNMCARADALWNYCACMHKYNYEGNPWPTMSELYLNLATILSFQSCHHKCTCIHLSKQVF